MFFLISDILPGSFSSISTTADSQLIMPLSAAKAFSVKYHTAYLYNMSDGIPSVGPVDDASALLAMAESYPV